MKAKPGYARGPSTLRGSGRVASSPVPLCRPLLLPTSLWICLGLIAFTVFVYAPVRHYGFVDFDDPQYVTENSHVLLGLSWNGMSWALITGYLSSWHPLTWVSLMLDAQMYGTTAAGYHLTNLLFHVANTLLLLGLLHWMTGALGRSAFVAALFAVHPLHVESVAWVSERKDVLSTLFWMLTLLAYVAYARKPGMARYTLVLVLFAFGLMAKPMLVTLPFVLLLLDIWPLGRLSLGAAPESISLSRLWSTATKLIWEKFPLFTLSVASSVVTLVVQQRGGSVLGLERISLSERLANVAVSYVSYISKMFWPVGLAAVYPYPRFLPGWHVMGALTLLIAISLVAIWSARQRPYVSVGWFWYLGTLVPVVGLVQVGNQAMADRYTYIPLIGLFLAVVWGMTEILAQWPPGHRVRSAAAGVVIFACAVTARRQVRYWKDDFALWGHTIETTAANPLAQHNLGYALAAAGKLDEAVGHYREAIRIRPDYALAHNSLGVALGTQGRIDEALQEFTESVRFDPNSANAQSNLGAMLYTKGQNVEAASHYSQALRLDPGNAMAQYNIGLLLVDEGKTEEAAQHFQAALRINPRYHDARRALENLQSKGNAGLARP